MAATPPASIRLEIKSGGADVSFDLPLADVLTRDPDGGTLLGAYALRWSPNDGSQPTFDLTELSRDWRLGPADVRTIVLQHYSPGGMVLADMDAPISDVIRVLSDLCIDDVDLRSIVMPAAAAGTKIANATYLDCSEALPVARDAVVDSLTRERTMRMNFVQFDPEDLERDRHERIGQFAKNYGYEDDPMAYFCAADSNQSIDHLMVHSEWVKSDTWRYEFLLLLASVKLKGWWKLALLTSKRRDVTGKDWLGFHNRWVLTVRRSLGPPLLVQASLEPGRL